jgi:hypothetical protein
MRKAQSVNVNTQMGGYSLYLGGSVAFSAVNDDRKIDDIVVYVEEYPDRIDTIINIQSQGKTVRQLINCPVDIVYKE